MTPKKYDVAIIGAGVCGAAIARLLSSYNIRTVLLEKCTDVGFGVSKANSGIIHAGFHHPTHSLKAQLEIEGNLMFEKLHHELGFTFKRVGILVVAFSTEQLKTIEHLYRQGVENGVPGIEICSAERIMALEPKLNNDAVGGLYAPSGGVMEPYRFVYALAESARKNGVKILTDFQVTSTTSSTQGFTLIAEDGRKIKTKYAINAAGLFADKVSRIFNAERFTITPRKGEEYLLDSNAACHPQHVLFPVPVKNSKGMLVIPTVEGTTMIGPTAQIVRQKTDVDTTQENLEHIFTHAKHMVPSISRHDIITAFAGLRPALKGDDFFIAISKKNPRFIQVAGIQSPGLTASPAIAIYVKNLLKKAGLTLTEKRTFDPLLPTIKAVRNLSPQETAKLIAQNPAYGNIICRCETVSEAEIVEAIHKGHTTLDGIKFYTRSGMGRCQGGFCTYKILKILARETGQEMTAFTKRGDHSYIVDHTL